ncbi:MAG: hypothetical protein KKI08_03605 [Armatimonadetes bacterium]|nr:hypothetical protein [Armatimonadota bacterium]
MKKVLRIGWDFRELSNSGMELVCAPHESAVERVIRVLKAFRGEPPHSGTAQRRMAFWAQDYRQLVIPGMERPGKENLLLVWSLAGKGNDVHLDLCKTKQPWACGEPPNLYWGCHIAFGPEGGPRFSGQDEADEFGDLRIDPDEFEAIGDAQ